jgi:hypothetical protein
MTGALGARDISKQINLLVCPAQHYQPIQSIVTCITQALVHSISQPNLSLVTRYCRNVCARVETLLRRVHTSEIVQSV